MSSRNLFRGAVDATDLINAIKYVARWIPTSIVLGSSRRQPPVSAPCVAVTRDGTRPPAGVSRGRRAQQDVVIGGRRRSAAKKPDLETKAQPAQERSRATFDLILHSAGDLLAERGIDGFTINAVVERAGLTPPAVYRYFPNKYALLKELGERLMDAQDEVVLAWMERRGGIALTETALIEDIFGLYRSVVALTRLFPGSVAILRAMRAVPLMREVRLASVERMARTGAEWLAHTYPHADRDRLHRVSWLLFEIGMGVIEMLAEGEGGDPDGMLREAAIMFARLQTSLA